MALVESTELRAQMVLLQLDWITKIDNDVAVIKREMKRGTMIPWPAGGWMDTSLV